MNPKYHLLIAVAALSLNACSTDDTCPEPIPENEGHKISFTVAEDAETRTTLEMLDAGNFLRWVSTDKVGIYTVGQNMNSNIVTTADVSKSPVEFVGTLNQPVSSDDNMFYAYYPYNAAQSTDPTVVKLSIPAAQTQTQTGVYNGESHPLVALPMEFSQEWGNAGRINSVRFRQLGAIVELQLYSSDEALRKESIHSVTFESETPLAGAFSFDLTNVTTKGNLPISGYESKVVTTSLEAPAAIPAESGEAARIYLTIAPGTYTGQIVVKTDAAQYTFRLAKALTFERAVIKGLPADLAKAEREILPDASIHFVDSEVKRICVENWDTDGDGELSYKEAAAVTDLKEAFDANGDITLFNELQYFTGLQSIGQYAFRSCSSLTSIHIPDGVITIGWGAFNSCTSLTSIHIPDGVTTISEYVFEFCSSLTSIHIPNGVTTIGVNAFGGCSSLMNIDIPDGVTSIEDGAFAGCSSLKSIHLPDRATTIGKDAFYGCSNLTNIHIPDGVTAIGEGAFCDCICLTSINIPVGVTAIEANAFRDCLRLTSIIVPDRVTSIGNNAFFECSSLTSIHIPDGVTTIGEEAFRTCRSLTNITIPETVTTIGKGAFTNCASLTSINIPQTVTSIGDGAFAGCSSLSAFYGKYASADHRCLIMDGTLFAVAKAGLTEYTIPNGVTTIESAAFQGCNSLKSVHIPETVTAIGAYAFSYCSILTSVYCKPTTPPILDRNYNNYAFLDTPSFLKIYVPTASVEAYKTAAGWSEYASQIVADNN